MKHESFNLLGSRNDMFRNVRPYKKVGTADFLVTDTENAAIIGGISDQLAIEGFMTQGFDKGGGSWRVIVSSSMYKKTDQDGANRLTELLDKAGFKAETEAPAPKQ